MSRASLLIPGLAVGHCHLFLAFWQIIGIRVEKWGLGGV